MAKIFLSYNRQSESHAKSLTSDLEELGHTVWFDKELCGGQAWWNQILKSIRNCELFVFILDSNSLDSTACKREFGYAADLGKPILPVMVSDEISTNLLPPSLSKIQIVDYRKKNRNEVLRLARSISAIPLSGSLPDPLPSSPEVPISYLGSLSEKVETSSMLTFEEQSALLIDLKKCMRDPEICSDTKNLIQKFRKRHDLYATIAEDLDELLSFGEQGEDSYERFRTLKDKSIKIFDSMRQKSDKLRFKKHHKYNSKIKTNQLDPNKSRPNHEATMKKRRFKRFGYWMVRAVVLPIFAFFIGSIDTQDTGIILAMGCFFVVILFGIISFFRRHKNSGIDQDNLNANPNEE
jgi:hypothetical protein